MNVYKMGKAVAKKMDPGSSQGWQVTGQEAWGQTETLEVPYVSRPAQWYELREN